MSKRGLKTSFASFDSANYRWFWMGSFLGFMAMNIQMITRGWLIYDMTHSPMALALVVVSFGIPMTLLSLVGGVLADRLPKRTLISVSQMLNAVASVVIAVLVIHGTVVLWHLLLTGVVSGTLNALSMPSRQAMIPALVGRDRLVNAIGLSTAGMNVSRVIGPAVAGVFIPVIGVGSVYIGMAVLYVFASLTVLRITISGKSRVATGQWHLKQEMFEGLIYVKDDRTLTSLVILSFLAIMLGMSFQNLLPAFVVEALDTGATGLGILTAITGAGALVGSMIVAALGNTRRKGMILMVSVLIWAITLLVFTFSWEFLLASAAILAVGISSSIFMALNMSLLQLLTTPEMMGRVMSISMMTFGLMPLGVLPISAIAEVIGTPYSLSGAATLFTLVAVAFLVFNRTIRRLEI